nr:methyl-accepting chemotaxis protein [Rhodocyclus gracilis]
MMSIAARIVVLVVVAVGALLGMGGFSLYEISNINVGVRYTNENSLPSIKTLGEAQVALLRARPSLLNALVEADPEKRAALEALFHKRIDQGRAALKDYEKLISDDKDRELLAADNRFVDAYVVVAERILADLHQGRKEEGVKILGEARQTIDGLVTALNDHSQYNYDLATQNADAAYATYDRAKILLLAVIVLFIALIAAIGFIMYRHVSGSLSSMVASFSRVEKDLDFTVRLPAEGRDEIAKVARAFNALTDRLQQSFRDITGHAGSVSEAAQRVAEAAHEMSSSSRQQSEAASSMAAAVEEMTVSVNHVADRAGDTNKLASHAGDVARKGEEVITGTVESINGIAHTVKEASGQLAELEQQSEKISSIVSAIKEIADQTNLLALNAAIEAARAGEQGRGFAVVADEVRKLAERTALSTQEIATTIEQMLAGSQAAVQSIQGVEGAVGAGVSYAEQASGAMQEIGNGSRETVNMVSEITNSIREQGTASMEIAQQVEKIAQMTEENSAAAETTSKTSEELAGLAQQLQRIVGQYRI